MIDIVTTDLCIFYPNNITICFQQVKFDILRINSFISILCPSASDFCLSIASGGK